MPVPVTRHVLEVLPHAITQAQVVVALKEEPEQRKVRVSFAQHLDPQWPQIIQHTRDWCLIVGDFDPLAIA